MHFDKYGEIQKDYEMFIRSSGIKTDDVEVVKVLAQAKDNQKASLSQSQAPNGPSLQIQGFSRNGDVIFQYMNDAEQIYQSFGVSVKKYQGHDQNSQYTDLNRKWASDKSAAEKMDGFQSEGPYIFRPDWRNPLPHSFGQLETDARYQKIANMNQWTIILNNQTAEERAIIKVR